MALDDRLLVFGIARLGPLVLQLVGYEEQCVVALAETREAFRKYGNLSSPSVLCALEERLSKANGDKLVWLTSFGAGFTAHSRELSRD